MTNEQYQGILNGLRETYKKFLEIKKLLQEAGQDTVITSKSETVVGNKMKEAFKKGAQSMVDEELKQIENIFNE